MRNFSGAAKKYAKDFFEVFADREQREKRRENGDRFLGAIFAAFVLFFTALVLAPTTAFADVYYVVQGASGSGVSWADAMGDPQAAIEAASTTGGEVWIKEGMYKPISTANTLTVGADEARRVHFSLRNGVTVIGGFRGDETTNTPVGGDTILTGDLSGNDVDGDLMTNKADNAYHVFYHPENSGGGSSPLDDTAVLRNVTICGGVADGNNNLVRKGGGIYNQSSSPRIESCIFKDNIASNYGGGMENYLNSNAIVTDCVFINNYAGDFGGYGGGMDIFYKSDVKAINCTFENNKAFRNVNPPKNYTQVSITD
jgi:hypothetical protein